MIDSFARPFSTIDKKFHTQLILDFVQPHRELCFDISHNLWWGPLHEVNMNYGILFCIVGLSKEFDDLWNSLRLCVYFVSTISIIAQKCDYVRVILKFRRHTLLVGHIFRINAKRFGFTQVQFKINISLRLFVSNYKGVE